MPLNLSRRDFLHVGVVGGLGLSLADYLRLNQARGDQKFYETVEGTAKSVIYIFLPGGMAQQETFDPKPHAPVEYRGPYTGIETNVTGVFLNEKLRKTAQVMDKMVVCPAMTHGEAAHIRGTHNMFTGYPPSPAIVFPSMGSVVAHEFEPRKYMPQYICVPSQPNEYAGTGYMSSSYAPFSLGADPASGNFQVRDLTLPKGIDKERFGRRRSLLETVNSHFASVKESDKLDAVDSFYAQAYNMVSSDSVRNAFDMSKETEKMKDRYGKNTAGMRMLLSRRIVEAGGRFITMTYGGWDHHDNIKRGIDRQMPEFDQAFAALLSDLDERGLLDSTLVCVATEFGRTPKINNNAGRDHWPKVFSIAMAGGGLKGGMVYGKSNPTWTEPAEDALTVPDWATTLYHCLGIKADKELMSPGDRPVEIVKGGKVIKDMLV